MTCIVGAVRDGQVVIGADSLGADEARKSVYLTPKYGRLSFAKGDGNPERELIFGYTTSYRMGDLIRFLDEPIHPHGYEAEHWLITVFVPAIRDAFAKGGFLAKRDEQEEGGKFLVGIDRRLFVIQSDFSVLEPANGYHALGSGCDFAFGALHANRNNSSLSVDQYLVAALDAAQTHNPFVSEPFDLLALEPHL